MSEEVKNKKRYIDGDEWYPVLTFNTRGWGHKVMVSQDFIDRYNKVMDDFNKLQDELDEL